MKNNFKWLLIFIICFNKHKAQDIDLKKIEYNAKFICFSDYYLNKSNANSDSLLFLSFNNFKKQINITYPKSKGFHLVYDTLFFLSIYFNSSTKSLSKNDSIKSKSNIYSGYCEYIICCVVKNNRCSYYKIKGFQINEYSFVLKELLNQHIINSKEIKNVELFCYTHQIEGIDIKCLHDKYLNNNNKLLYNCCVSCINKEKEVNTIYLLEDNRKIFNSTMEQTKSLEGYFIPSTR